MKSHRLTPEEGPFSWSVTLCSMAILMGIGFLSFYPVLAVPFQGADQALFLDASHLHRIVTVPEAFETMPYAPLTLFAYALNWSLVPFSPFAFHALNLFLHLCNALLIYLLALRLAPRAYAASGAFFAALLFLTHPLMGESLTCIVGRPMIQGSFFSLLALLGFLEGARPGKHRVFFLSSALILCVLAWGSHHIFLLLPLLACAVLALHAHRHSLEPPLAHYFMLLSLFAFLGIVYVAGESRLGQEYYSLQESAVIVRTFIEKSVWPQGLYSCGFLIVTGTTPVFLFLLAGGLAGAVLLFRGRIVGLAILWLVLFSLGLVLFLPKGELGYYRQFYVLTPALAFLLLGLFSLLKGNVQQRLLCLLSLGMMLCCVVQSHQYSREWTSPTQLWRQSAEGGACPAVAWRHLGAYYRFLGSAEQDEAQKRQYLAQEEAALHKALTYSPDDAVLLCRLGATLFYQGKLDQAESTLLEASKEDPFFGDTALYLAFVCEAQARETGDKDLLRNAARHFRRAQERSALTATAQRLYGFVCAALGDFQGALDCLRPLAKEGQAEETLLRQLQGQANRYAALTEQAQELLALNPDDINGHLLALEARIIEGDSLGATLRLSVFLERHPKQADAWAMLGWLRAAQGQSSLFLREWGDSHDDQRSVWEQLIWRCAQGALWNEALAYQSYYLARKGGKEIPHLFLAELALKLQQEARAKGLLKEATSIYAESPVPWMALATLAERAGEGEAQQQYLEEAYQRGQQRSDAESTALVENAGPL